MCARWWGYLLGPTASELQAKQRSSGSRPADIASRLVIGGAAQPEAADLPAAQHALQMLYLCLAQGANQCQIKLADFRMGIGQLVEHAVVRDDFRLSRTAKEHLSLVTGLVHMADDSLLADRLLDR